MAWDLDSSSPSDAPFPGIRQDLSLLPGEPYEDGEPSWILHDPFSNRFFRFGGREVELLACAGEKSLGSILEAAEKNVDKEVTEEEIKELVEFLRHSNLVEGDDVQQNWYQKQNEMQKSTFARVARSFLFFRIPLWHPDNFLKRTLPYVSWLLNPLSLKILVFIFCVDLYLLSRNFDEFLSSFPHFFNLTGLVIYGFTLLGIKIIHELGHAYVAKGMGCRIPVIGVAFMVGIPVLFTDTSDAWKLPSRKKRLFITAAGVGVECVVACLSLLVWNIVPDGVVRSALFFLTSSWVFSILINSNPLMKFDGYFFLSDLCRMPNLEQRATALGRWWLRETLFGFGIPSPEKMRYWLLFFAGSLWVYRFFLFLGIAIVVYYFFFKSVGIILFIVEITYFLFRPVWNEIREWWKMRKLIRWNRTVVRTLLVLTGGLFLICFPWKKNITIPAYSESPLSVVYSPIVGQLVEIEKQNGDVVKAGDLLLSMQSRELEYEMEQARNQYKILQWQKETAGFSPEMLSRAVVVATELRTQEKKITNLKEKETQLLIRAPHDGEVVDMRKNLKTGEWLGKGESILSLVQKKSKIIAFVPEEYVSHIENGAEGIFYPEKGNWAPMGVVVDDVEEIGVDNIDSLYPVSLFGGDLAVRENAAGKLIPVVASYKVRLHSSQANGLQRPVRGSVKLKGNRESFITQVWRRTVALLRREIGF